MTGRLSLKLILLTLLIVPGPAFAGTLMEVKAGYAVENIDSQDINQTVGANAGTNSGTSFPKLETLSAVSADAIAFFPALSLGLGARYEKFTGSKSSDGQESKAAWERVSVLASYRAFDEGFYFGPIASLGVSNEFKYTTSANGSDSDYKAKGNLSASGGLEAGAKLSILRIGLEAGYLYAMLGEIKDSLGNSILKQDGLPAQADLSGPYAKVLVGLGF